MLHTLGYECSVAVDGVEACNQYVRAKADGHPFSAVLLDATIPNGISGEEALKLILAEDPDAGVILCSGYADGDLFRGKCGAIWIQSSGVAGVQELQNESVGAVGDSREKLLRKGNSRFGEKHRTEVTEGITEGIRVE